jgi:hypothetical protein
LLFFAKLASDMEFLKNQLLAEGVRWISGTHPTPD